MSCLFFMKSNYTKQNLVKFKDFLFIPIINEITVNQRIVILYICNERTTRKTISIFCKTIGPFHTGFFAK